MEKEKAPHNREIWYDSLRWYDLYTCLWIVAFEYHDNYYYRITHTKQAIFQHFRLICNIYSLISTISITRQSQSGCFHIWKLLCCYNNYTTREYSPHNSASLPPKVAYYRLYFKIYFHYIHIYDIHIYKWFDIIFEIFFKIVSMHIYVCSYLCMLKHVRCNTYFFIFFFLFTRIRECDKMPKIWETFNVRISRNTKYQRLGYKYIYLDNNVCFEGDR